MNRKRNIKIILLIVLALIIYSLPIISVFYLSGVENETKTFEIKDDIIDIENGTMTISDVSSFYKEEDDTYYIVGYLKNETTNSYKEITLSYTFYDENGIVLGEEYAYASSLDKLSTWKYKVLFSDIDAQYVKSYEIKEIMYYRG